MRADAIPRRDALGRDIFERCALEYARVAQSELLEHSFYVRRIVLASALANNLLRLAITHNVLYERGHDLLVAVPALTMGAFTVALDTPTVRHEPLGDVATTTGVPGEVSLEALSLRNLAADPPDHFNHSPFFLKRVSEVGLADNQTTSRSAAEVRPWFHVLQTDWEPRTQT
jgi:hypothetical protein